MREVAGLDHDINSDHLRATRITSIKSAADPSSRSALFDVKFDTLGLVRVEVPLDQIGSLIGELHRAGDLLATMTSTREVDGLAELRARAPRPTEVEVIVDPLSQDRIFRMEFEDNTVIAFTMGAVDLAICMMKVAKAAAAASN